MQLKIKIPDLMPGQEDVFRIYLNVRQLMGLGWETEQQLAASLLASADELKLTPRQIETLKEIATSPLEQLLRSTSEPL